MGATESGHDAGAGRRPTAIDLALDWVERLLVAALYACLVVRVVVGLKPEDRLAGVSLLLSEGLVVVFILLRRAAVETSRQPGDWLLATAATCAPLLVNLTHGHPARPIVLGSTVVWMIGFIVQVHAKLTLRRSFGCVPAHRGLVRGGPYQFVRHPMYAGYALSHVGILAMNPTALNLACYLLGDGLQVPRILAEERLLSRDPRYRDYQARVRYRLIPGLF
jgi:protein-S-isoprenylcysteine O-methyltransferase Ste14